MRAKTTVTNTYDKKEPRPFPLPFFTLFPKYSLSPIPYPPQSKPFSVKTLIPLNLGKKTQNSIMIH